MVHLFVNFVFTSNNGKMWNPEKKPEIVISDPLDMTVSLEWYDNAVKVSRKKGVRKNKLT